MSRLHLKDVLRAERRLVGAATREALRFLGRAHGPRRARPARGARPDAMAIAPEAQPPHITWSRLTPDSLLEQQVDDPSALRAAILDETVDWVHVRGFGDEAVLRTLGGIFGLHPLELADIVNVPQRPKVDPYEDHLLIVLRMARAIDHHIEMQQLSVVVGPSWVLTFEEHGGDVFDPVRERLRTPGSLLRRSGADFLAYALIDAVVDGYFPVIDFLSDLVEELEVAAIDDPEPHTLARIHAVRRLLIQLERTQRQQRDALLSLSRLDESPFGDAVQPYLRDVQDHAIHMLDATETLREMTVGVMDIFLSSVSNRTNDVMKALTIMASLFIPLTFIAGVYGMNFDYMPELHWRWGYPAVWGLMIALAIGMLLWFRRRGWLSALRLPDDDDASRDDPTAPADPT